MKRVLLIRANRNEADASALGKYQIASRIDPYLNISSIFNPSGAQRMLKALQMQGPKWLIATSTNALPYWVDLLPAGELETAFKTHEIKFAAIGSQTASQLSVLGAKEVLIARSRDGASLAEQILLTDPLPVVIPSGAIAMQDIPNQLAESGFEIVSEVVYCTEAVLDTPASVSEIAEGSLDAVLLKSPSAARAFLQFNPNPNLFLFCAGNTTANELRKFGLEPDVVAPDPAPESVAFAISEYFESRQK